MLYSLDVGGLLRNQVGVAWGCGLTGRSSLKSMAKASMKMSAVDFDMV